MNHIANPDMVDVHQHHATVLCDGENIVLAISPTGLAIQVWDDDSDGDPHHVIDMTFAEWRAFAAATSLDR